MPVTLLATLFLLGNAQAAKKIDPYTLLTLAEAQKIVGKKMRKSRPPGGTALTCEYVEVTNKLVKASVTVIVHLGGAKSYPSHVRSMVRDLGLKPKAVAGLGTSAVYDESQLVVQTARHSFIVVMGTLDPPAKRLAQAKEVAKKVIARLPK